MLHTRYKYSADQYEHRVMVTLYNIIMGTRVHRAVYNNTADRSSI